MEADRARYQNNSKLFITCMICLMASLSLFAFAFYILPYLIWGWHYSVPGFILMWREEFVDSYAWSNSKASMAVFSLFFIPALITGIISWFTSNKIENNVLGIALTESNHQQLDSHELGDSFRLVAKIIMSSLLAIAVLFFIEWLLTSPLSVGS